MALPALTKEDGIQVRIWRKAAHTEIFIRCAGLFPTRLLSEYGEGADDGGTHITVAKASWNAAGEPTPVGAFVRQAKRWQLNAPEIEGGNWGYRLAHSFLPDFYGGDGRRTSGILNLTYFGLSDALTEGVFIRDRRPWSRDMVTRAHEVIEAAVPKLVMALDQREVVSVNKLVLRRAETR